MIVVRKGVLIMACKVKFSDGIDISVKKIMFP